MVRLTAELSENQSPPETRINPRFLARIAIFHGPYQNTILTNYSINISTGGVFIESNTILPLATELTVKFVLPNADSIIASKARVAWINDPFFPKKPALPHGMGLEFLDLSMEAKNIIEEFLLKGKFNPTW